MNASLARFLRFFSTDIAMDLGTANTLLYTRRRGIFINEPSVVAIDARDGSILAIGETARQYIGRTHPGIRTIRPLKDGVIADFDITRAMISTFARRAISRGWTARPSMVICIPSGITQVEKRAVIDAATLAGARSVRLVEEPMAAALGADLPVEEPVGNMVVDIGGGTSEVAIISLCGVSTAKSARVAGDAMNMAVQRYIREEFRLEIGENTAENVKILIGSAVPRPDLPSLEVSGKDIVHGVPRTITLREGHVREAIGEQLSAIMNTIMRALDSSPPELAADVCRNGILLAGGGSLLKGLDQYISRATRVRAYTDSEPLTTVLRGTAKAMNSPKRWAPAFI